MNPSSATLKASIIPAEYEVWVRFLASSRSSTRNEEVLTSYFLREFGARPEEISRFLVTLQRLFRHLPKKDTVVLAAQYLQILSPICERFALFHEKNEMDTLCFRLTDPAAYKKTDALFSRYKRKSGLVVAQISRVLSTLLRANGFHCEVSGRYKNLYSIHKKLVTKRYATALSLQDIFAFRIILPGNVPFHCFDVLNLLHDTYTPDVDRFKDYISIPKVNGYQSIHTILRGVATNLDLPVEVQIRTHAMHEFAEHGLASHWFYGKSKRTHLIGTQQRQLFYHYHSLGGDPQEHTSIYCLTPKGDVLVLHDGATVREFAKEVHTELGRAVTGAIIRGKKVPPDYRLTHGDEVNLLVRSSLIRALS